MSIETEGGESVLLVQCPDRKGIVAAVSSFLTAHDASIVESNHFNDSVGDRFYMRTVFRADGPAMPALPTLRAAFEAIATPFAMSWKMADLRTRPRIVIAVSKHGHCLVDLMHRWRAKTLRADIVGVVSNHEDMRQFVEWCGVPFHHLPIGAEGKPAQERRFLAVVRDAQTDLVVLARYMQILSAPMCEALQGRCINIHHSFLPGFKGARPYQQAHDRGVKLIGATAHYVTSDLDEGPIIEQGVARVSHAHIPEHLAEVGRDVECAVLARAVKWHVEHRVVLNGVKTVVFA